MQIFSSGIGLRKKQEQKLHKMTKKVAFLRRI